MSQKPIPLCSLESVAFKRSTIKLLDHNVDVEERNCIIALRSANWEFFPSPQGDAGFLTNHQDYILSHCFITIFQKSKS